ncbi:MAG TPA: hypothetical protein VFB36_05985 [Nevskiaceae bacterium]|nr:hypothetical protein [Nevskiaceae bacterium]
MRHPFSVRADRVRAFLLLSSAAAISLCHPARAADPATGTLTDTSGPVTYTAGPFTVPNPTPVPELDSGPECSGETQPCDDFVLTVELPAGYEQAHPTDVIKFTAGWTDTTGAGVSDYDLHVYKGEVHDTDGSQQPDAESAGGDNPEVTTLSAKSGTYTVKIKPFTPSGEIVDVTIELVAGEAGPAPQASAFGQPDAAIPDQPRYQVFAPDDGVIAENQQNGEYNIGFNPKTGNIMAFAITFPGHVYRVTPPELATDPLPESCDAAWVDASPLWSSVPQAVGDPILWTDQDTGRTFETNLVQGPNLSYAYSDDDGATWNNVNPGTLGGADHETIATGPYPDGSPYEAIAEARGYVGPDGKGRAVYYCSQDTAGTEIVGGVTGAPVPRGTPGYLPPNSCVRSDDGGLTWGAIQVASDGSRCGKTHGHVKVAYDGTAYLPSKGCLNDALEDEQGGMFTTDAGDTWQTFTVPGATRQGGTDSLQGSDPSIGIDKADNLYYCYVAGDGHAYVNVGRLDNGALTWGPAVDIGIAAGVKNASFTEAVAGDEGRAACGFLGTNKEGNYQSLDFDGLWYLFMAHTYDGGQTWTTVNATPNDPVQGAGGIWQEGGSNKNRNLLDFNEVTVDDKGRVLFGYDDGCVGGCIADPAGGNTFAAAMRVARQTGGKSLYAAFDQAEPVAPKAACLIADQSFRTPSHAHLEWHAPDHGGAEISGYKIYRAATADSFSSSPIAATGATSSFDDLSQDGTAASLFYKITAVNAQGESVASNIVELPLTPDPMKITCTLPGLTLIKDASADNTGGTTGQDLQWVAFAEPADQPGKFVITMKVDDLSTPPPSTRWVTYYDAPDGSGTRYVAMVTGNGLPAFEVGSFGRDPTGTVGLYSPDGAPDDTSSFNADGTITFVLDKAALGLKDGDDLKNMASSVRTTSAAQGAGLTVDSSDTVEYRLRGSAVCALPDSVPTPTPTPGTGGDTGSVSNSRFGGALGLGLLLPFLMGGALWRNRLRR